jgi:hypothetical protein
MSDSINTQLPLFCPCQTGNFYQKRVRKRYGVGVPCVVAETLKITWLVIDASTAHCKSIGLFVPENLTGLQDLSGLE